VVEIDSDTRQRLAFLNLGDDDRALLAELEELLEKHADNLVASFYRHLLSFAPTRKLLRDPEVKNRLLGKQREYLLSLARPSFDTTFVAERRQIGEVHQRIGLDPRWYLGAYALYQSLLTPVIWDTVAKGDPERGARTATALQKLLWFDAQLAMEAYIEAGERNLDYLTEELAEQSRKLEREVEDQGAALRQTRAQARAAEELASIATLVAGLAHEIGTPMGVIQGHAKMLESKLPADDADAHWRLETIQGQIARISRIIKTLLNMARPRRARRVPIALGALLQTTLSFVDEKLARRQIQVESNLPDVPSVMGDPERVQQLFLNLFLNAADAMPDGGHLRVSLELEGDTAVVRVADTGTGIRPEDLARVFDPFFTTKAAGEGNGLGLMVCKGIAGDHGGAIDVISELGVGTEFRVVLPVPAA
jgi:signal transduction histidine kinase